MPSSRKEIVAWSLYDFANSAFTTLVVTFIFSNYFTNVVASDPTRGTILWSRAVNVSAIVVALAMPLLGAIADYSGRKKLFLAACTVTCCSATVFLFWAKPGNELSALVFFVIANIGYEASYVFYNAFLPEISTNDTIGRVSGFGQGLGYVGGLLCLLVALGMVNGWIPSADHLAVRATNILVAAWFALFSLPTFLFMEERRPEGQHTILSATKAAFGRLADTAHQFRRYREAAKLLIARMIYNDGLVTVFSFASIFAAAVFGMGTGDLIRMGLVLNVVSGIGSWALGPINDRIGGKKTIVITLVALIVATVLGAAAKTVAVFWVAAIILGLMIGPNQAASRGLLGVFVPAQKHAEFFGFFAFSGRLASVLGPFAYGTVLQITHSQRWAMASIGVFFVAGLALLALVDEKKGIELGSGTEADPD
jgi:UMF1 family MFS transporter